MINIPSVPAIPLTGDLYRDSQWKQWLLRLQTNANGTIDVAHGGTGIVSYTIGDLLYASATTTLSKLADVAAGSYLRSGGVATAPVWSTTTLPNSATIGDLLYASAANVYSNLADVATKQVLVSGGVGVAPAWSASPTLSGNLTVEGNTTLGDASADTLTINAGTWTLGSNAIATRAAGSLAAGTTNLLTYAGTFSANVAANPNVRGILITADFSGAQSANTINNARFEANHNGSATITTLQGFNAVAQLTSSGAVTNARGATCTINLSGAGAVATGSIFLANTVTISSSGGITDLIGFSAATGLGNTLVTTVTCFYANDQANSTNMRGFRSALSSGAGKFNAYFDGTADNIFAGNVRIGSTTAPTVALDVTGTVLVSGQVRVSATTGISAAGSVQGDATALTTVYNSITTAAAGTGVILRAGSAGEWQTVYNGGANPVNVYPPSGANINQLAANIPHILSVNTACQFSFFSATLIIGQLSA